MVSVITFEERDCSVIKKSRGGYFKITSGKGYFEYINHLDRILKTDFRTDLPSGILNKVRRI